MENKKGTLLLTILLPLLLVACSFSENREYSRATLYVEKKEFKVAVDIFEKIVQLNENEELSLKAARDGSKLSIFEIKDFFKAIKFLRFIVLYSPDADERFSAQKQIAYIHFDNLAQYQQAIIEFNRLLQMPHKMGESYSFRMVISRSYFYLNQFDQAESEIDEALKLHLQDNQKFEVYQLKANVYIARKQFYKAIQVFQKMLKDFPELSAKENIVLNMALCYEEEHEFAKAIEVLQQLKEKSPTPEYFEIRIKRLKDRQKNQPGAKGFRK